MQQQTRRILIAGLVLLVLAAPHAASAMCGEVTKERLARDLAGLLDCYAAIDDELRGVDRLLRRVDGAVSVETARQAQAILGLSFLSLEAAGRNIRRGSAGGYEYSSDPDVEENANTLYERIIPLEERQVELEDKLYDVAYQIMELSAGQHQRVGIARSLVMNPKLVIMDEPTDDAVAEFRNQVGDLVGELDAEDDALALLGSGEDRIFRQLGEAYLTGGSDDPLGSGARETEILGGEPLPGDLLRHIGAANAGKSCIVEVHSLTVDGLLSHTLVHHRHPDSTRVVIEVDGERGKERFESVMVRDARFFRFSPDAPFFEAPEGGLKGAGAEMAQPPIDHKEYGPAAMAEGLEQEDARYLGVKACASAPGEQCHVIAFLDAGRVNEAFIKKSYEIDAIVGGDKNGDRRVVVRYPDEVEIDTPENPIKLTGGPEDIQTLMRHLPRSPRR